MSADRSAATKLERLRRQLTLTLGLLVAVGLGLLATTATVIDSGLRHDRFVETQQGLASRAAALVFFDEDEQAWDVSGVIDDMVTSTAEVVVVSDRSETILYSQGESSPATSLISRGIADSAEEGVVGTLTVGSGSYPAAAAPYFCFDTDDVCGAVVVASPLEPDPDQRRLQLFVWSAAGLLTAASIGAAWLIAGRVLQPIGESIDREARFLSTAAHELRTPTARSLALAEATLLSARDLPASEQRGPLLSQLRRLIRVSRQGSADLNDLLYVGRVDADQLQERTERVRLDMLVASFEESVPELAVETHGPVEIQADPSLIRHALVNLFTNAQRHGQVDDRDLLIQASVQMIDLTAVVTIRDNGSGLGDTDPDEVFERHYSNAGGTGLGLWIVRRVVEDSQGTIGVTSSGLGTVFEIRWPAIS